MHMLEVRPCLPRARRATNETLDVTQIRDAVT